MSYEGMKKGIDLISSDSDDVYQASKPRVSLAEHIRSSRGEEVWDVPVAKKKEESQNLVAEPEERVGDMVRSGKNSYFIIDIFEKEIMELGDEVDLNFKRFNKFEDVYGDAPRDHHFYNYRCCYSSRCRGLCTSRNVEKEWELLKKELNSTEKEDGFSKGVSFFVRTYTERKELMRVAVTVANGEDPSHSLFFFDLKFPTGYPNRAPSFFYHPYDLPLSTLKPLKYKPCYNVLDVFLHIQEIVLINTHKSCQQMLDMLKRSLIGFEDFVIGHFRKYAPSILRNLMEEIDMEKERDRNKLWRMYIAFEDNMGFGDNKAFCEYLLNSDLKEELEKFKEKECSLYDYYHSASSPYFPTITSKRFNGIKKTFKSQSFWNNFL